MSAFRFGGLILCLVINNEPFKFIVPESLCVTGMTLCAHLSHFSTIYLWKIEIMYLSD